MSNKNTKFNDSGWGKVVDSLCLRCIHQNPDGLTCAAFPDGIPVGVLTAELDHTKPIKGDKGIRFEAIKER